MAVASSQLWANAVTGGGDDFVYTVAADYRTIVKSVRLTNSAGYSISFVLLIQTAGGERAWFWQDTLGAGDNFALDPCWIVMNAGDQFDIFSEPTGLLGVVSGAELPIYA